MTAQAAKAIETKDTKGAPSPIGKTEGNVTAIHPTDEAKEAHARAGERAKAAQSAARKANGTATTSPKARTTKAAKPKAAPKPKAAAKPKTETKRVPGEAFVAELKRLGLTNTQAAKALGVSNSSVSEYVGHGRGRTMAQDRWADAKARLAAFAKGIK